MALDERTMLTGISGWRATWVCGSWFVLLANPVCNLRRFGHSCLGTFGAPCVLCDLVSTTSIDSVGHAPAATVVIAVYCRAYTVPDVFSTTSVPCGLRHRQRTRRPHNMMNDLLGEYHNKLILVFLDNMLFILPT